MKEKRIVNSGAVPTKAWSSETIATPLEDIKKLGLALQMRGETVEEWTARLNERREKPA